MMASEQLFIHFSHLWKTMRKCAIESSAAKLNCRGQWSNTMKQSEDRKVVFIHPRAEHSFNSSVHTERGLCDMVAKGASSFCFAHTSRRG